MKAPLSWIRDYAALEAAPQAVADALRMAGVGIESVEGDVLDLEITANRADLLSMIGVAREAALVLGCGAKELPVDLKETGEAASKSAEVSVEDRTLCPRYVARVVRGVKVGPSPSWMQGKLAGAGVRAVNNVVDITNFVMLECGQPLHAFDLAQLRGARIVVRRARAGETMTAIDGRTYGLTPEMLVIADAERPVAVAGVMGGKESEIADRARDVVIESALFDPVSIRRTSRRLGLASESSYRFERGVDWETVEWASRRAAQLLADLAGGSVCRGSLDVAGTAPARSRIRLRASRVRRLLGMEIPRDRIEAVLRGLGCRISGPGEEFDVEPPSRRKDLKEEVDLIEEIVRIEGYGRVPTDLHLVQRASADRRDDLVRERVRETLISLGMWEVCTWSFSESGTPNRVPAWSSTDLVPLKDPQGKVDRMLRESLVPEFLRVLARNESYKEKLRPIFEIASVYSATSQGYGEKRVLALAAPSSPGRSGGAALHVKGLVGRLLESLGLPARFPPLSAAFLRSGTSGSIEVGCKSVGYLGEPAADLRASAGLEADCAVAELDFDALAEIADLDRKLRDFSRRPPVDRDVAVVLAEEVSWARIESTVRSAAPEWLESVAFFDVYRGKPVPPGRKSVAFSLRFRALDRTLTGEEADAAVRGIVDALGRELGAALRS